MSKQRARGVSVPPSLCQSLCSRVMHTCNMGDHVDLEMAQTGSSLTLRREAGRDRKDEHPGHREHIETQVCVERVRERPPCVQGGSPYAPSEQWSGRAAERGARGGNAIPKAHVLLEGGVNEHGERRIAQRPGVALQESEQQERGPLGRTGSAQRVKLRQGANVDDTDERSDADTPARATTPLQRWEEAGTRQNGETRRNECQTQCPWFEVQPF
eukprot:2219470-Prymnesium_polylepis.2